jgi:hypothetical protein
MAQALHRHRITLTVAFGALLVAAAVLATTAAGDDQAEPKPSHAANPATNIDMALELRDDFIDDVAKELDQDPARVRGAVRTVVGDWVERFERRGFLTDAQAGALLDCWDGKECRLPGVGVP